MLLNLILVSFATSTLVRLEGWEIPALEELVAIMTDVVVLHDESRTLFNQHFVQAGIVSSGKLTGFNLYHELFASTLNPNFPVDSLEHPKMIIGVVQEAVGEAADDFENLFQILLRFPFPNVTDLVEIHNHFSGRWSSYHESLTDLRSRCGISSKSVMPRADARGDDMDQVTLKYFVDLMALFTSMRDLVDETRTRFTSFFEWLNSSSTQNIDEPLFLLNSTLASLLEEFRSVRAMKMHEKLEPLVQDATEFAIFSRLLGDRVSSINTQVSSLNSSDPVIVEFNTILKNFFIKKWKEIVVRSAVLKSRLFTELERRNPTSPPRLQRRKIVPTSLLPSLSPEEESEREKVMSSLIEFAEASEQLPRSPKQGGGKAQTPVVQDLKQGLIDMIDIMEHVVVLHEECGKFLIDAYASAGFSGHNKFAGIVQYRNIFSAIVVSESVLRENQTQIAIAVAHESVGDVIKYFETLLSEIEFLGFQLDENTRPWIAEWKSIQDQLHQLRIKYNVPDVRFLPHPRGVYTSDTETVKYLGRVMQLFSQMRELLTGSYSDILLFQSWIAKNRKYFSQLVRKPFDTEIEANVTAVLEDFKRIETIRIHESLEVLLENASHLESWSNRFATHILRLIQLMSSSIQIRNDRNAVADFLKALRQFHYPKWNECFMSIVPVRQGIEQELSLRANGERSLDVAEPTPVVEVHSEERDQVLTELLKLAALDGDETRGPGKRGGRKKSTRSRRVHFDIPDESSATEFVVGPVVKGIVDDQGLPEGEFLEVVGRRARRAVTTTTTTTKTTTTTTTTPTITTTKAVLTEKQTVSNLSVAKNRGKMSEAVPDTTTVGHREKKTWSATGKPITDDSSSLASTEQATELRTTTTNSPSTPTTESIPESSTIAVSDTTSHSPIAVTLNLAKPGRRKAGAAAQRTSFGVQQPRPEQSQGVSLPLVPPVVVDLQMDECMRRMWYLTQEARRTFAEMTQLCYNMEPRLWSSGNIEGAMNVGSTRQMAQNAFANTQMLEGRAYAAWRSQFTPRP